MEKQYTRRLQNKVLIVATSDIHIKTFHLPYLEWLRAKGCEVHLAIENRGNIQIPHVERIFYLQFPRTPFSTANLATLKQLKMIVNENAYDVVHCHTPVPSMLTRIAAMKSRRKGTRVLYTAHGFHFFKGSPIRNWLSFFPVEFLLSAVTDAIVTINSEDYQVARRLLLNRDSYYIRGIGVDATRFKVLDASQKKRKRTELGYSEEQFLLLYIAEFIHRKNHHFIISALPRIAEKIPHVKVLFAGTGALLEEVKNYAREQKVDHCVEFLGFRDDAHHLAAIADVGISSSRQEGLGLGLAEEMLCAVPVVATIDRGHRELVTHGESGYLFEQGNQEEFISYITKLHDDPLLRKKLGEVSLKKAAKFTLERSLASMAEIYKRYLDS